MVEILIKKGSVELIVYIFARPLLTKEKIAEEFGENIANQVMNLTRIKENGIKISVAEMVELLYTEKKYDILLIKLFDRLHNMQTIGAKSPEKIKKIINETLLNFIVLMPYLGIASLEKHFYRHRQVK